VTRLTALLITGDDPDLSIMSYGPIAGKFGLYIGTMSESPSGFPRPRPLLTSEPIYESAETAEAAARAAIREAHTFLEASA
jgi:hypothetical protein